MNEIPLKVKVNTITRVISGIRIRTRSDILITLQDLIMAMGENYLKLQEVVEIHETE